MGEANERGWELSRLFSLDRDDDDTTMELSLPSGAELGQRLAADGDLLAAMRDVLAKMAPGQMEPPLEAEFAGVKRLLASGCRLDAAEVAAIEGEIAALDNKGSEEFAAGDRDAAYRNTVRHTALPPLDRSFLQIELTDRMRWFRLRRTLGEDAWRCTRQRAQSSVRVA